MAYKISIHEPTDEAKCISLPRKVNDLCSNFYQHGSLPNFIGAEDVVTVVRHWEPVIAVVAILERVCYQHMSEIACYLVMPKCDPGSRQINHPCREMCHDFRVACSKIVLTKNTLTGAIPFVSSSDKNFTLDAATAVFDCDYLPSLSDDIPCFYKPVMCKSPPVVKNAAVLNNSVNYNNFSALDIVDYSCNEGFQMDGHGNISCLISGQWSTPPKCIPTKSSRLSSVYCSTSISDSIGHTACNYCSEIQNQIKRRFKGN